MHFYPSSYSAGLWCDPSLVRQDEEFIKKLLRPGDTFIDIGANVGCLTLAAWTTVGAQGRVISIEAHPKTAAYLRGNVSLNRAGNIDVIHCAVGETTGEVSFSDKRSDEQNQVVADGIRVPLKRLDDIIPPAPVRLLKIDVEGFELFVLKGAQRLLEKTDYVYFESWEKHAQQYGYSTADVIRLLRQSGFSVDVPENYVSTRLENLLARRMEAGDVPRLPVASS